MRNAGVVATEVIREAIIDGRLAPGERLKEEELARELGLSRTPIREALAVLQAEGLVDTAPNRGATVRAHDAEDLDDLYRLRALLEGYAAGRAATKMPPEQVAELFASCERFEALADGDVAPLVKENMHFHSTIVEAAASGRVAEPRAQGHRAAAGLPVLHLVLARAAPHLSALPPPDRRRDRGAGRRSRRVADERTRLRGSRPARQATSATWSAPE